MVRVTSFSARYRAGEHREVWRELVELGDRVRDADLIEDASAVAFETMSRIRRNLERIHSRLLDLGFRFADPERALKAAGSSAQREVDRLEQEHGALPLSGRAWYLTFDGVRFEQAEDQLHGRTGPPELQGLGSHPSLIVRSIEDSLEEWNAHLQELRANGEEPEYEGTLLLNGPTLSSCDTAAIELGKHHMDETAFATDGPDDETFIAHIRDAVDHGGFPFWHHVGGTELPAMLGVPRPAYERIRAQLFADLEPF